MSDNKNLLNVDYTPSMQKSLSHNVASNKALAAEAGGIPPSEWEETLKEEDVFDEDEDPSTWKVTYDNYKEVLKWIEFETEDIEKEVECQLRQNEGKIPFSLFKKSAESLYYLANEISAFETPAKDIIKTLKLVQKSYIERDQTVAGRVLNQRIQYSIDNIARKKLYTVQEIEKEMANKPANESLSLSLKNQGKITE
jgi:hypothetical protein